jgi:hypothetical protein
LCEQENRHKPGRQRQFGLLDQRSGDQRRLVVTPMALKHVSRVKFTIGSVAAVRAAEACRPAQPEECVPTGRFGAVAFQELGQTEPILKLNLIPDHFATSCLSMVTTLASGLPNSFETSMISRRFGVYALK